MPVQSIVFKKSEWTLSQAKRWLHAHKYKNTPDIKPMTYRFRQKQPNKKYRYITKKIVSGKKSISLVIQT